MQHMAAKGWVCVAINYRLSPRDAFPAHVIDVKRAIAWIREHIEEYGGNPDYIAITGGSAGGHLAALAALTAGDPAYQPGFEDADTSVQAAIPHYGVYDFAGSTGLRSAERLRDEFLAPRILQKTWADSPDDFEAASPILRITADAPDFFVLHGKHDSLVPVDQARLFVDRLRATSKRTVVYAELPGAQHAFDVFPSIRSAHVVRAIDRYLHWHWNGWRDPSRARADPSVDRRPADHAARSRDCPARPGPRRLRVRHADDASSPASTSTPSARRAPPHDRRPGRSRPRGTFPCRGEADVVDEAIASGGVWMPNADRRGWTTSSRRGPAAATARTGVAGSHDHVPRCSSEAPERVLRGGRKGKVGGRVDSVLGVPAFVLDAQDGTARRGRAGHG